MRTKLLTTLSLAVVCLAARQASASVAFPPPDGGWTYEYNGDVLNTVAPMSLDGTWFWQGSGSDSWDGSTNGGTFATGNAPGGWTLYTGTKASDNGVTFLRMQDSGNPTTVGFVSPANAKLQMARSMTLNDSGASLSQLSDGLTLCFRARIPTLAKASGDIDPLYPNSTTLGGPGPIPYPAGGDGYMTLNGGKGNIFIHDQSSLPQGDTTAGASIAFSLTQTNDNNGSTATLVGFGGLTMNELNGNVCTRNVDFGQGSSTNRYLLDPTDWHEFWIVLKADPSGLGTHEAYIFVDGNLTPKLFHMTSGNSGGSVDPSASGYRGATFISIASASTGQSCAFDLDFLDYKLGESYPAGAINNLPPHIGANTPAFRQPFYSGNLSVEATTAGTNNIPTTGAQLVLNGVNASAGLAASGSAQDRTFTYSSLQPNTLYSGQMVISDQAGRSVTNTFAFDTFVEAQVTLIEAEDYNYGSGQSIDNPAPGAYSGKTGTYKVDFLEANLWDTGAFRLDTFYRTGDPVHAEVTPDFARPRFTSSGQTDFDIGTITRGQWCNYTRTIAAGSYTAVLRAASSTPQDVRLDLVTSSPSAPNQTVKYLGSFHVPESGGANNFVDIVLGDMQGNPLPLALSGSTTLRLTAVGANQDLALNYLVLSSATAPATPAVSTTPAVNERGTLPNATIEAAIVDGSNPVDAGSVGLTVNGSAVTPTSVVKSGSITLVKYTPSSLWPASRPITLRSRSTTARPAMSVGASPWPTCQRWVRGCRRPAPPPTALPSAFSRTNSTTLRAYPGRKPSWLVCPPIQTWLIPSHRAWLMLQASSEQIPTMTR